VYRTSDDEYVVVSAPTDAQVARVLELIGLDDDASRAAYGSAAARVGAVADELDARVARWIGAHTRADVLARLDAARIPCAPIHNLADLVAHEQVVARRSLVALGELQHTIVPAPQPHMSQTPATIRHEGRREIGADTDAVLHDWLPDRA
jgi:crotonobetainyl-CoA:carnitine CoA-transferase CaiB-like acyl-CoA transferase